MGTFTVALQVGEPARRQFIDAEALWTRERLTRCCPGIGCGPWA